MCHLFFDSTYKAVTIFLPLSWTDVTEWSFQNSGLLSSCQWPCFSHGAEFAVTRALLTLPLGLPLSWALPCPSFPPSHRAIPYNTPTSCPALRAPPEGPAVGSPFPCQSPLLRRLLLALTSLAVVRQGSRGDSHMLFVFPHGPCGNGPCNGYSATPSYDDSCGKTYLFTPLSSAPKVLHSLGDLQDPSSTWQQTHP